MALFNTVHPSTIDQLLEDEGVSAAESYSKTFVEKVTIWKHAAHTYRRVNDLTARVTAIEAAATSNTDNNDINARLLALEKVSIEPVVTQEQWNAAQQNILALQETAAAATNNATAVQAQLNGALKTIQDLQGALADKANTTYVDMRDNFVLSVRRKRAAAAAANSGGKPTAPPPPSTTPQDQDQDQETHNDNDNTNVPGDDDAAADTTSSVGAGTVVAIVAVVVFIAVVLAALVLQCKRNPTGAVATCSANCLARLRSSCAAAGNQSNEEVDPPNAFPMMENPMHETSRADGGGEVEQQSHMPVGGRPMRTPNPSYQSADLPQQTKKLVRTPNPSYQSADLLLPTNPAVRTPNVMYESADKLTVPRAPNPMYEGASGATAAAAAAGEAGSYVVIDGDERVEFMEDGNNTYDMQAPGERRRPAP